MNEPRLFSLPKPLAHFQAVAGSAEVVADAWGKYGVVVVLQSGRRFCVQTFDFQVEAARLADALNQQSGGQR
jgi:hypothetical protein